MAKNTGFKRHFPKLNSCCFCMSLKKGVIFFTYLFLIFQILGIVGCLLMMSSNLFRKYINHNLGIIDYIASIIYIISLILLLVGMKKIKIPYMRQFKYVYIIYFIYVLVKNVIAYRKLYTDEYRQEVLDMYNVLYGETITGSNQVYYSSYNISPETYVDENIESQKFSSIIGYIIGCLLDIYYYVATCSYIEDVEESVYDEDNVRNLESN